MHTLALTMGLAALIVALPAPAVDLPKRKSGLWEVTTVPAGGPPSPAGQLCIDEKTDDMARQLAAGAVSCSRQEVRREAADYVIDSVCRIGEATATTRARISGSFETAYQVDVASKYDPPLFGTGEGRATVKARWLGPCKPGQRAGDMTLPGGITINVFDAPGARPPR